MTSSLLALLDDIIAVLDDVAVQTKVAAQRTVGIVGDDLAINAEQVSGVRAERELPVIWAVAKGSAQNKLILVPVALLLAAFADFLILPLLMLGGCYLCYEGMAKILDKFFHRHEADAVRQEVINALHNSEANLVKFERQKIKGAIRTDFVLSTEIIVITIGTVQDATFITQAGVVIAIAVIMTVGIYGLVAAIIKLDDAGLALVNRSGDNSFLRWTGNAILSFAPWLMKALAAVGTVAMFLVGGDILARGIPGLEALFHLVTEPIAAILGGTLAQVMSLLLDILLGMIVGICLIPPVNGVRFALGKIGF